MNNVIVSKKNVNANFDGFFKGDVSKKWIFIKLPMKLHEVVVNGSKTGTKYFANLYVDACKVGIIELKGGQPLNIFYALYKNYTLL